MAIMLAHSKKLHALERGLYSESADPAGKTTKMRRWPLWLCCLAKEPRGMPKRWFDLRRRKDEVISLRTGYRHFVLRHSSRAGQGTGNGTVDRDSQGRQRSSIAWCPGNGDADRDWQCAHDRHE